VITSAGQSPRRTNSMAQLTHDSRSWCRSSSATRCHSWVLGVPSNPFPTAAARSCSFDDVVAVEHGARALAAQAHGFAFRDGSVDLAPRKGGIGRRPRLVQGRRWREGDAWSSTHVAGSAHRRALLEARSPVPDRGGGLSAHRLPCARRASGWRLLSLGGGSGSAVARVDKHGKRTAPSGCKTEPGGTYERPRHVGVTVF